MEPNTTVGDNYNIHCPYCGHNNVYVTDKSGFRMDPREIKMFGKACFHCKQPVIYRAEWVVKVTAARKGDDNDINLLFNGA